MTLKDALNLLVSAGIAGIASFLAYFSAGGEFNKAGVMAALGAAIAAAVNHLRKPPVSS